MKWVSFPKQFTNELFAVSVISIFEFIYRLVKIIIPIIYESTNYYFSNGKIEVKLDGKKFYIDAKGKKITQ